MKYEHPNQIRKCKCCGIIEIQMWDIDLGVLQEVGITSLRIPSIDSRMTNEQLVQPSVFLNKGFESLQHIFAFLHIENYDSYEECQKTSFVLGTTSGIHIT